MVCALLFIPALRSMAMNSGGEGREIGYVHFLEHVPDGISCASHNGFVELSDRTDAEARPLGELSRIDGEAALAQRLVEPLEIKIWVARCKEGLDDRASFIIGEQGFKAHS